MRQEKHLIWNFGVESGTKYISFKTIFPFKIVDAVNSWGGGHGRDSHTEWQVTTNHTTPLPEKSQSQSGNGFGNENDNHIKVVLVGAPGVGKTSMVQVNSPLYFNLMIYQRNII